MRGETFRTAILAVCMKSASAGTVPNGAAGTVPNDAKGAVHIGAVCGKEAAYA